MPVIRLAVAEALVLRAVRDARRWIHGHYGRLAHHRHVVQPLDLRFFVTSSTVSAIPHPVWWVRIMIDAPASSSITTSCRRPHGSTHRQRAIAISFATCALRTPGR